MDIKINKVPKNELDNRMNKFRVAMDMMNPEWEIALVISKVNQYYFTGTMQDGLLIIPREDKAEYWVRRNYDRAVIESNFQSIHSMNSYKDIPEKLRSNFKTLHLENSIVTLTMLQFIEKYFNFKQIEACDFVISSVRMIKSSYEIKCTIESGKIHEKVLEQIVPELLEEGMSEADLATSIYSVLVKEGHQGISRIGMFQTEMVLGNICFGESSIYPSYFNGPGGSYGMSPSVPLLGNRENKLKKGDLVFVDIGCGVEGYHTDKTNTYIYKGNLPEYAIDQHNKCVDVQNKVASMLKPKAIPEDIYFEIMDNLDDDFKKDFMGYESNKVKFLGHGVGLLIDEFPVIAKGFKLPIEEGMIIALEPKKGIKGVGMVGIENTFLVTKEGGKCITGNNPGLIKVY